MAQPAAQGGSAVQRPSGLAKATAAALLPPGAAPRPPPRVRASRNAGAERAGSRVEQVGQVWGNAQGPALAAELLPTCEP